MGKPNNRIESQVSQGTIILHFLVHFLRRILRDRSSSSETKMRISPIRYGQ